MDQQVQITLDTEQVRTIASQLENDNDKLRDLLEQTKETIDSLAETWTGPAAEETRASYTDFSNKFFEEYRAVIEQYVKFLRTVADNFENTEHVNESLADAFK